MNCITMLLKTSDVMAVRRAIFAAGASRVAVFPVPDGARTAYIQDWYFGNDHAKCDTPIRIDVGVDESHTDDVISAFLMTAHIGMIKKVVRHPEKSKSIFQRLLRAA